MALPEWYHEFVDSKAKPAEDDVVALFRFQAAPGISRGEALGRIASESSVGTWTTLANLPPRIRKLKAVAYSWRGDLVKVAYPRALWEPGSIPQLLSGVAGNIFGMKAVERLRLEDIHFPAPYLRSFAGPALGIAGIRRRMGIRKRPITVTVPKPKLGFTAAEHARVGLESWLGGVDLVKDDENLTSQSFNRFDQRVERLRKARNRAEAQTGETKSALINITAETHEALRRARILAEDGWEYAMVDVVTMGWSAVQSVREFCGDHGIAIHGHRAMHAMFTKDPHHGMSMPMLAKLARVSGIDQFHVGTGVGKLYGEPEEVRTNADTLRKKSNAPSKTCLGQEWGRMKPALPTSSGGLHPGIVPDVLRLLGPDIAIQLGGGIHGHPGGSRAGAKCLRDVIEGTLAGERLDDIAEGSKEVAAALKKWHREHPV
jgi:ribulose-bisphosphate carboxylase large chain